MVQVALEIEWYTLTRRGRKYNAVVVIDGFTIDDTIPIPLAATFREYTTWSHPQTY